MKILKIIMSSFALISHGKRSDKETQSPMLKIFKDIMQKESNDPEKTNLLKNKHAERKRKQYSSSRSKSGHHTSNVSSSSERQKPNQAFKMEQEDVDDTTFKASRSQSLVREPFPTEKRDSWWFWRDNDAKSRGEDTCSCVSCALRKLITTDSACIACLTLLLVVSGGVAIMLIYRSMPCLNHNTDTTSMKLPYLYDFPKQENDRLKRKIGNLGVNWSFMSKSPWNHVKREEEPPFGSMLRQNSALSYLVDPDSDLTKILDFDKISGLQNSDRLRDFYRRLMQTDAAIRNLRKTLQENPYGANNEFNPDNEIYFSNKNSQSRSIDLDTNLDLSPNLDLNTNADLNNNIYQNPNTNVDQNSNPYDNPNTNTIQDKNTKQINSMDFNYADRLKRSIRTLHRPVRRFRFKTRDTSRKPIINNGKVNTKTTVNMTANKKNDKLPRNKRNGDYSQTEGFIIEKNKVVIHYNPSHVVAKCTHSPKDAKSHETQLKHPYYKNTERLDELLEQFMDRRLPDLFPDRFEIDNDRKHSNEKEVAIDKDELKYSPNDKEVIFDKGGLKFRPNEKDVITDRDDLKFRPKEKEVITDRNDLKFRPKDKEVITDRDDLKFRPKEKELITDRDDLKFRSNEKEVIGDNDDLNFKPNEKGLNTENDDRKIRPKEKELITDHDEQTFRSNEKELNTDNDDQKFRPKEKEVSTHRDNLKFRPSDKKVIIDNDERAHEQKNREEFNQRVRPKFVKIIAPEVQSRQAVKTEATGFKNNFMADSDGIESKTYKIPTNSYDIILSISTIISPALRRTTEYPNPLEKRAPNARKLMQVNAREEEGIPYEDLKEVLSDYKEGHDEEEKEYDRKKRNESNLEQRAPFAVNNPNWKGALPLYPDELTQMVKQRPEPTNTFPTPVQNRRESDDGQSALTDIEYVENYSDNGYEKLVHLAQAYSDYGVLGEKKESNAERKTDGKSPQNTDDRARLSVDGIKRDLERRLKKSSFFGKLKKGAKLKKRNDFKGDDTSEGIRIELQPTTRRFYDNTMNLRKMFEKHVKLGWGEPSEFKVPPVFPLAASTGPPEHLNEDTSVTNEDAKPINDHQSDAENKEHFKKRTLKSVDLENGVFEENAIENFGNVEPKVNDKIKRDLGKLFSGGNRTNDMNKIKTETNENVKNKALINRGNLTVDRKDSKANNMTLKEFFIMLSNWFRVLNGLDVTSQKIDQKTDIQSTVLTSKKSNSGRNTNSSKQSETSVSLNESDTIESIGHRSRELLSVDLVNETERPSLIAEERRVDMEATTEAMNTGNSTKATHDDMELAKNAKTNKNSTKKHKVKRQAIDDSNLIFWNDLYDDEYGIKGDPIENNIRDKHSIEKTDFLKRSHNWLHDKVKMFGKRLNFASSKGDKVKPKSDGPKLKRSAKHDEVDSNGKINFAALTAKMKDVCKKTIRAVEETSHVQTRENSKEEKVATSLMQQLVRLMTDLVDFQVHERTCRKLPSDLQNFLEWLTSSEDSEYSSEYMEPDKKDGEHLNMNFDKATERDLLQPSERENPDSKTDCLGTLQAVQTLMRQYEDMSDDDKSIMTGVKDYLERQMNYLQTQLSIVDHNNIPYQDGYRFRRETKVEKAHTVADSINAAAHTIENQYKKLKLSYREYKRKLKEKLFKDATSKTTRKLTFTERLTSKAMKHTRKDSKHRLVHKKIDANKNVKAKEHNTRETDIDINDKVYLKDNKFAADKEQFKDINHKKDNKSKFDLKDEDVLNDKDLSEFRDDFDNDGSKDNKINAEAKNARNLKKEGDFFDNTEVLRIN